MSTVSSVCGSAWKSSQVHLPTSDPPAFKLRFHLSSGVCGVGPAVKTGKSSVTYWPGGTRCRSALARSRPVKPLVEIMGGSLGVAPACVTTRSGDRAATGSEPQRSSHPARRDRIVVQPLRHDACPCQCAGRSDLKAARSSAEKSSGSSQAGKWPPLSTSLKYVWLG